MPILEPVVPVSRSQDREDVYGIRGSDLRLLRTIQGVGTQVPTTGAIVAGRLWVVNARFLPNPQPTDDYWITQLPTH